MKILILGSNGFIGSNALQYFRSKFPDTVGCDVTAPAVYDENFLLLDRTQPQFDKIFLQYTFDVCINASGSGSVQYSFEKPDEDYRLNAKNVFDILNSISNFNSRCRFLHISSAAVYGNPEKLPINEKSRTKPLSPYGFHKLISEQICAEYFHLKKIRTCSMRVFSAYGVGLRKQLFWDIFMKTKQSGVVELSGTGEESRDFIYISDLLRAMECILEHGNFEAEVINVASGKATTIYDAASILLKTLGADQELRFSGKVKEGDPKHMLADIEKIKAYHFSPAVDINKGLALYTEWIIKTLK